MAQDRMIPKVIRKRNGAYLGEWINKIHGTPNAENIEAWRQRFNASLLPGGCNAHLGASHWLLCTIEVFDQQQKRILATGTAPMFEIIPC